MIPPQEVARGSSSCNDAAAVRKRTDIRVPARGRCLYRRGSQRPASFRPRKQEKTVLLRKLRLGPASILASSPCQAEDSHGLGSGPVETKIAGVVSRISLSAFTWQSLGKSRAAHGPLQSPPGLRQEPFGN